MIVLMKNLKLKTDSAKNFLTKIDYLKKTDPQIFLIQRTIEFSQLDGNVFETKVLATIFAVDSAINTSKGFICD